MDYNLSVNETEALDWLIKKSGVMVSDLVGREERGFSYRLIRPSKRVMDSLVRKGWVVIVEDQQRKMYVPVEN